MNFGRESGRPVVVSYWWPVPSPLGSAPVPRRDEGPMRTKECSAVATTEPPELLPIIRNSGVLTEKQLLDVRSKVASGEYPADSKALAQRLVREGVLTDYQARKLLSGRA